MCKISMYVLYGRTCARSYVCMVKYIMYVCMHREPDNGGAVRAEKISM